MINNPDVTELSIAELFKKGQYRIPIFQRNYSWGEQEVEQLLQDILDVSIQDESVQKTYYIGSLVVDAREDGSFGTIDGQQRQTTLSIVLAALLNECDLDIDGISRINLAFDSRPKSEETLRALFSGSEPDIEERSMRSAYEVVTRFFSNEKAHIPAFKDFLLNRVKILRVVVPKDTDLNHYFEIMNNRGEQLEKHEVLKARLMNNLDSEKGRICFAAIWDACAEMNRYVQLAFPSSSRTHIFGGKLYTIPSDFDDFCLRLDTDDSANKSLPLIVIIQSRSFRSEDVRETKEGEGAFSSVINFSNFLLHTLRIMESEDVPLDDKRLLSTFDEYDPDPKLFIMALLKCRMLFDRYIIKRENDEDWSLKKIKLYDRKQRTFSYVNSFNNEKRNQQLTMLLSMFHVSFPALAYKHWLNGSLNWLYQKTDMTIKVNSKDYLVFLEELSERFFFGRFNDEGGEPIDYFDLIYKNPVVLMKLDLGFLNHGTSVQNFIFNRLDYLLWRQLKKGKVFDGVNMEYIKKRVNGFSFTFRTSVEHYFPQNPRVSAPLLISDMLPAGVDSFGNLCLISRSDNSKLSNYLPTAKKEHYEKATTVESLKQVFMMSYKEWGPDSVANISHHEKMMVEVLVLKLS